MKYINKILLIFTIVVFISLISCEEDDILLDQKPSVTLISPTNKMAGIDTAPEFEWEAKDPYQRPLKYDFLLGLDSTKLFTQAENLKTLTYKLKDYKLRKDGTYYWRIVAKNGIEESESDIFSFQSIPSPASPQLTSPENNIFVRDQLIFEWNEVPAGAGEIITYNIFLDKNEDPIELIGTIDDGSTTFTFDASTLEIGEVYYWKIDATDIINKSSSEVRSFKKLRIGAPDEPIIISPLDRTGVSPGVALDWSDVTDPEGDAVSYDVYLDKLNTPVTLVATVTNSEYLPIGLDINSAYYWYVVAKDPAGNITESEISGFTAIGVSPGFPVITPFMVQDVFSLDESLKWDAAAGATSYDVYIDTVNPPLNLVASDLTETEYLVKNSEISSDLVDPKTYYALVVAKDGTGGKTNSFPVEFIPQMTGVFKDVRAAESLNYNWIRIGTQVWMSQNLRTKKLTSGEDLLLMGATEFTNILTATSTELYYDEHDLPAPGFPTVWSDGDNGRVYSSNVYTNALIAPPGWHVINDDDVLAITTHVPNAGDLLDEFYGGSDPYGANFVTAGYRYGNFNAGRPAGFRYAVEESRTTFWFNSTMGSNAWEVYPDKYRPFNQGNAHTRMFGIRLVKD